MKFLHTMLRVGDLQRSIDFYTQVLGMQLLRTSENPEYKYSLAFLGFEGGNPGQAEIELTYNWVTEDYGEARYFGHLAFEVDDIYEHCERLEREGSGYVARHDGDAFFAADPWFRGIDLTYGPDGGVFVLDWSDTGECHERNGVHRSSGRIYKITYANSSKQRATAVRPSPSDDTRRA
mgnify:CR=1 FL=1